MKRVSAFVTAGMVTAFSSISAFADLLVYEPFDYLSGSAVIGQTDPYSPGSPAWARAGTAGTSDVHQAVTGSLAGPSGFPPSIGNGGDMKGVDFTEYARMNLPTEYGANATLYYSVLLNVPSITGLTTAHSNVNANNDGILALNNNVGASATRPNTWAGELAIRLGNTANTFNLGVRSSTTASGTTYFTGDLNPGQTYLVVVGFTEGATPGTGGLSSMWLNPSSATFGAAIAPTADGSTAGTYSITGTSDHTDSLIIGAGIAAGAAPNDVNIDEIRVGTTWADVTSQVPEPSSLMLAASFGALGLAAWYRARRR
jgi:hypothetical protein